MHALPVMVRNRILERIENSGGPAFVSVMKPAYFGNPKDVSHLRRLHAPSIWRILPKRKMTSRAVVILQVRGHVASERELIHDDNMVQAFSTYGADEPFNIGALPGRSESGEHFADVQAFSLRPEGGAIDAVAISEQVPRRAGPRESQHKLRRCPFGGRMLGDIEMQDTPAIMS